MGWSHGRTGARVTFTVVRIRAEDVIEAAFAVLDEHGLDGLTTRRLTQRLGVAVGAIYWHVRDKRELLSMLADRIVADAGPAIPAGNGQEWDGQLLEAARGIRRAMLAHRDGARLVAGYAPIGARSVAAVEAGLAALVAKGLPLELAALAGDTVMSYVTGFVLQEQTLRPVYPDHPPVEELPLLSAWTQAKPSQDAAFEQGLAMIVDGVRTRLRHG